MAAAAIPAVSAAIPAVSAAIPAVSAAIPAVSAAIPAVSAAIPAVSAAIPAVVTLGHPVFQDQPQITLISSDGREFVMPKNVVEQSLTIKELLSMSPDTMLKLDHVEGKHLDVILKWAIYHTVHPCEITSDADKFRTDNISPADQALIAPHQTDYEMVFPIARAANWLHMENLLRLYCKIVANQVKSSTPESLREKFTVPKGAPSEHLLPDYDKTEPAASAATTV